MKTNLWMSAMLALIFALFMVHVFLAFVAPNVPVDSEPCPAANQSNDHLGTCLCEWEECKEYYEEPCPTLDEIEMMLDDIIRSKKE